MSGLTHVVRQGPVMAALVRTAFSAARGPGRGEVHAPGPVIETTVPPRDPGLVRDYVAHVGGDPAWYRDTVPAHLFPQWGFPVLSRVLEGVPFDLRRVLNAGCRIEVRRPIPQGRALRLRACLESVDDDGRRALLTQRLETTPDGDDTPAMVARVVALVPLRSDGPKAEKKDRPRVADDADALARFALTTGDGLTFAALTGDFNPVHWLGPYARAAGFKGTILHGFGTLARAYEGVVRAVFAGDPSRMGAFDVRFVRPLVLPAQVALLARGRGPSFEVWVGDAPGGPAYLTGTVEAARGGDRG